jgi:YVTN family beta-propeller protein
MQSKPLRHRTGDSNGMSIVLATLTRRGSYVLLGCLMAFSMSLMLAASGAHSPSGFARTWSDRTSAVQLSSFAQGKPDAVWAATNQDAHGILQPIGSSGSAFDVEVGDLLNSFAGTASGTLGLATASDSEGSSDGYIVSPSISQVFSLSGSFTNLDGSAVLPDDQWGYLADQGFSESAALDAVNLTSHEVYEITSLPGFSPALSSVAACPNGKTVVATDNGDNQLDIFSGVNTDPTDPSQSAVSVGSDPVAVACSKGFAYVADEGGSTLEVVDLATATVTRSISVGTSPDAVAIGPKNIYVANSGSNSVSVIRLGSTKVKTTVGVGSNPDGIAVSGDVYVTNHGSNNVSVLSPGGGLIQTISGVPSPEAISVGP